VELRRVRVDDAEALAATVAEGFESFRGWALPGWEPPEAGFELSRFREGLSQPSLWGLVGVEDGEICGHVTFVQAREREEPRPDIPGLAHLWQLFVRPRWWGTGLATRLNRLAVEEAARQGYETIRLFTPAGNARARAFYEREGWRAAGEAVYEPVFGMDLVEYRRALR
jgi:ribosomal protein S18 acetylase RimI-like enzyme